MRRILAITLLAKVFTSCKEDPNPCAGFGFECAATVESHWELIEIYSDPGNGSGSFNEVESERTITIFQNGDFISKGSLYILDVTNTQIHTGEIEYTSSDNKLVVSDCSWHDVTKLPFSIDGDEMIVDFSCYEGCKHKYKRVD